MLSSRLLLRFTFVPVPLPVVPSYTCITFRCSDVKDTDGVLLEGLMMYFSPPGPVLPQHMHPERAASPLHVSSNHGCYGAPGAVLSDLPDRSAMCCLPP